MTLPRTLLRAGFRETTRHPWQAGLSILGIALGVAVVVSIDLANESARQAWRISAEAVIGRATHSVVGGPDGLDERVYARLRLAGDVPPSAPVVEGIVSALGPAGRTLELLGVDPLADAPFRSYWGRNGGESARGGFGRLAGLGVLLTEPGAVLLSRGTAAQLGLRAGSPLSLRVGGLPREARLVGLVDTDDARSRYALDGLVLADLSSAQELLGRPGRLDRIDLAVPDGPAGAAALARVRSLLPANAEVVPASSRVDFLAQLTRAFSLNLTALSLLALVVGLFLVYSTTAFAVVRRRTTLGTLRGLGVTRGELLGLLLTEGLLLGGAATTVGLGAGVLLARGLVGLVARTINDLYFALSVRDVAVLPATLAKGWLLGIGATLLGVVVPALEATAVTPRSAMTRVDVEVRARRRAPGVALAGVAGIGVGAAALALSGRSLPWSYAGLFTVLLGSAMLTPLAVVALARLAAPTAERMFGVLGRLAARSLEASLSRTAVALAALVVAVATSLGVGLMIASFRRTVVDWLATSLVADVYVSVPGPLASRAETALEPAVVARLASVPGVAAVGTYRRVHVRSVHGPTRLVALDLPAATWRQFRFLGGSPTAIWRGFDDGDAVIVSEPYAYRQEISLGASVQLLTDRGPRRFRVVGVFADYGSDQGVVMLSRRTYERYWDDRRVSSLGLTAAPGVDPDALVAALRRRAGTEQELLIRRTGALREASLVIFDRTFAITGVLRLLATIVAFAGVLSALMALQLERGREVAVLRAQGVTPRQVWGLTVGQTGLMGLVAGLLALPVGVALAEILVVVINRRSFGWTLAMHLSPWAFLQAVGVSVGASLLAGVWPALRMARAIPATALREE